MTQSKTPGWLFWLICLFLLQGTIAAGCYKIASAIRSQTDVYLCMEALKVLPDTPVMCDPIFGTDKLKGVS